MKLNSLSPSGFAHYIVPILMVAVIAVVGGYVLLNGSSAATLTGAVYLESGVSGKCLDDAYDKATNGTKIQSYACNKSAAQAWELNTNGTIENANGKCIDNDYGKNLNDNPITVYTCSASNTAEQWKNTGSILKNPTTNKCIDLPYGTTKNGTALQLYTCNGKKQQSWSGVKVSASTGSSSTGSGTSGGTATIAGCSVNGVAAPCVGSTTTGSSGWGTPKFDDEFSSTSIAADKDWATSFLGSDGPINSEEQDCYNASQVVENGGMVDLNAIKDTTSCNGASEPYLSGDMTTSGKYSYVYGFAEAQIWVPGSDGKISDWPSFWTDGQQWPEDGEIDILEGLDGTACAHYNYGPSGADVSYTGGCNTSDYTGGWHTFAADWESTKITYYYDGKDIGCVGISSSGCGSQSTPSIGNSPMYLVLALAVGQPGSASGSTTAAPATEKVNYVRVWQK